MLFYNYNVLNIFETLQLILLYRHAVLVLMETIEELHFQTKETIEQVHFQPEETTLLLLT